MSNREEQIQEIMRKADAELAKTREVQLKLNNKREKARHERDRELDEKREEVNNTLKIKPPARAVFFISLMVYNY